MAEARREACNHRVTGQGEIETAARARTVDGGDCRCGVALETLDGVSTAPGVRSAGFRVEDGYLTEMGAGEKDSRVGRAKRQGIGLVLRDQQTELRGEFVEDLD